MKEKIKMANYRNKDTDLLVDAILTLDNREDCYRFLEDLCSAAEFREMSKRILAAKMLRDGNIYTAIGSEIGLSTATISRVSRCLKFGDGGYNTVLANLEKKAVKDNKDNKDK